MSEDQMPLIRQRRSIREYRDEIPAQALIEKIVGMARYAPSAHNAQPWRFVVMARSRKRSDLVEQMALRWKQDLQQDGVTGEAALKKVNGSVRRFSESPILVIVWADLSVMDAYPDERRQAAERTLAVQSTAAAIQNVLLAAHAFGIGACWYCAPLFCPDIVRDFLLLEPDQEPMAFLTMGYPKEIPGMPARKEIHEFLTTL